MPQPRHRATTHHTAACSPGSVQALRLGKKHYPAAAPTLPPAVPPTPTNTPKASAKEPSPPAPPTQQKPSRTPTPPNTQFSHADELISLIPEMTIIQFT